MVIKQIGRAKRFIKNPWRIFYKFNSSKLSHILPDEIFLKLMFRARLGQKLNLDNPQTFNEKLQWLKLHDRNPEYTKLVDKYEVREYIRQIIGEEYLIPLYGVWNTFDEIDFDKLPNEFVLKCTHDSGSVIICRDKASFDYEGAKKSLTTALKENFYYRGREWPYKNVKPRIIAEQYMGEKNSELNSLCCEICDKSLTDYKFFCFNGNPQFMYISNDAGVDPRTDFFDMAFNHLPFKMKDPPSDSLPAKPHNFNDMIRISKILSEGFPHVRVDFYDIHNRLYVGELTLYHSSGFSPVYPAEWNKKLGQLIELPPRIDDLGKQ